MITNLNRISFKVVSYRKGMVMSTDWCDTWLEADMLAEDRMKHPNLYDEVRIIRIGEENA
jgi:hypothetical protein